MKEIDHLIVVVPNPPTRIGRRYQWITCTTDPIVHEVTEELPDPNLQQYARYMEALAQTLGVPQRPLVVQLLLKDLDFATAWYNLPGKRNVFLVPGNLGEGAQEIVKKANMPLVVTPSLDADDIQQIELVAQELQNKD